MDPLFPAQEIDTSKVTFNCDCGHCFWTGVAVTVWTFIACKFCGNVYRSTDRINWEFRYKSTPPPLPNPFHE